MKRIRLMKQLAVTTGLLVMCSLPAALRAQDAAQPPQSDPGQQAMHGHRGQGQEGELAKLNLTDDQKAQVQKIHEDMKSQIAVVRNNSSLSPDQQHAKVEEIRKSSHEQVKQVLTPEQRKQMKSDEMARRAARQQDGQTTPPQQ